MRIRKIVTGLLMVAAMAAVSLSSGSEAKAANRGQPSDWRRFYYYPYVYYPQNFQRMRGSNNHLYYRYSPERRIPVYNKSWYNFYPTERPYHSGHHFILDVF